MRWKINSAAPTIGKGFPPMMRRMSTKLWRRGVGTALKANGRMRTENCWCRQCWNLAWTWCLAGFLIAWISYIHISNISKYLLYICNLKAITTLPIHYLTLKIPMNTGAESGKLILSWEFWEFWERLLRVGFTGNLALGIFGNFGNFSETYCDWYCHNMER